MKDVPFMTSEKESTVMKQLRNFINSSKEAKRLYRRLQLRKVK